MSVIFTPTAGKTSTRLPICCLHGAEVPLTHPAGCRSKRCMKVWRWVASRWSGGERPTFRRASGRAQYPGWQGFPKGGGGHPGCNVHRHGLAAALPGVVASAAGSHSGPRCSPHRAQEVGLRGWICMVGQSEIAGSATRPDGGQMARASPGAAPEARISGAMLSGH